MEKLTGKSILKGIAIGKILFYQKDEQAVKRVKTEDTKAEIERYVNARKEAVLQLNELYKKAVKEVGEMNAAVFEVHAMMQNMRLPLLEIIFLKCLLKWMMITLKQGQQMLRIFQKGLSIF